MGVVDDFAEFLLPRRHCLGPVQVATGVQHFIVQPFFQNSTGCRCSESAKGMWMLPRMLKSGRCSLPKCTASVRVRKGTKDRAGFWSSWQRQAPTSQKEPALARHLSTISRELRQGRSKSGCRTRTADCRSRKKRKMLRHDAARAAPIWSLRLMRSSVATGLLGKLQAAFALGLLSRICGFPSGPMRLLGG